MNMTPGKHDKQPARPDRPAQLPPVPVTRLVSIASLSVINGVLTTVRILQAA